MFIFLGKRKVVAFERMRFQDCCKISILIILLFALIEAEEIEEIRKKCQSEEGLQSCGFCTKQHPECSWCSEPAITVPRCDHRSTFTRTCPSAANSAGQSEISVPDQHNVPLGNESPRTKQPIQIFPQQVYMRLKPGKYISFIFAAKIIEEKRNFN
uniref:Integrin beta N-terminal domain-containing protein n=1 Tax=Panagrolaimus superbus TaxID=310955 RepID=A0A914Y8T1_9BILA